MARLFFTIIASAALIGGLAGAEPGKEGTYGTHETHTTKPVAAPVELARPKIEIVKLPVTGHPVALRPAVVPSRTASGTALGQLNAAAAKHATATLDGTAVKRKP